LNYTFRKEFFFQAHGSVLHNSVLIKIQPDATVCRYLFTAESLYMFRVSQYPSSGVLKTVNATSGTGHNTGTATSLQRGLIGTGLCESCGRYTFHTTVNKYLRTVASGWIFINISKEHCMLPEDDRMIETCRSVLGVLM